MVANAVDGGEKDPTFFPSILNLLKSHLIVCIAQFE